MQDILCLIEAIIDAELEGDLVEVSVLKMRLVELDTTRINDENDEK